MRLQCQFARHQFRLGTRWIRVWFFNYRQTKGVLIDTLKKVIYGYLIFTGMILLMSFSMSQNGHAVSSNPAWGLIHSLRTILLWVGGVPTFCWLVTMYMDWKGEEYKKHEKEQKEELEKAILQKTEPVERFCRELYSEVRGLSKKLSDLERERKLDQVILKELEEKQNRSAEDATDDALSDFI